MFRSLAEAGEGSDVGYADYFVITTKNSQCWFEEDPEMDAADQYKGDVSVGFGTQAPQCLSVREIQDKCEDLWNTSTRGSTKLCGFYLWFL